MNRDEIEKAQELRRLIIEKLPESAERTIEEMRREQLKQRAGPDDLGPSARIRANLLEQAERDRLLGGSRPIDKALDAAFRGIAERATETLRHIPRLKDIDLSSKSLNLDVRGPGLSRSFDELANSFNKHKDAIEKSIGGRFERDLGIIAEN